MHCPNELRLSIQTEVARDKDFLSVHFFLKPFGEGEILSPGRSAAISLQQQSLFWREQFCRGRVKLTTGSLF